MADPEAIPPATEAHRLFSEEEFITYTLASNQQRFINFLIDNLLMQYLISWLMAFVLVKGISALSPQLAYDLFVGGPELIASYVIGIANHLVYYTISEKAFRGYTLGKLVTGTRVIRDDGEELTFKDALLRSLCRLVPFETLSIWFSSGLWHDSWTRTKVIQTR